MDYQSLPSNPIVAPGTYTWVARYDAPITEINYTDAGPTPCGVPAETFTVVPPTPTISTVVSAPTPLLGGTSTDTALLTAPPGVTVPPAPAPTGVIRFRLYDVALNPTCDPAGTVHSTVEATTPVNHFGPPPYLSQPSNPVLAVGTYTWTATFESGDPNYLDAGPTACLDPAETFTLTSAPPTITTQVDQPPPGLGGTSTDSADLIAPPGVTVPPAPAPTGLIRFRLFNTTDNPTCDPAGTVHSTSTTAVDHFGPPPYVSQPSNPITRADTYTWTAVFESGDANYPDSAPTACLDPAETFTVLGQPQILVDKTADPLSRPAPGGTFTFTVVVTNPGPVDVTIDELTDDIYGDLATRAGSTCGALIGTTLAPGASSAPCSFTGPFDGDPGDSQTDVVTVIGHDDQGRTVTADDDATVTLTPHAGGAPAAGGAAAAAASAPAGTSAAEQDRSRRGGFPATGRFTRPRGNDPGRHCVSSSTARGCGRRRRRRLRQSRRSPGALLRWPKG